MSVAGTGAKCRRSAKKDDLRQKTATEAKNRRRSSKKYRPATVESLTCDA